MAKKLNQIEKAIQSLEGEKAAIDAAIAKLRQQVVAAPKRTRKPVALLPMPERAAEG